MKKSVNTVTIHWYAGSWLDEEKKAEKEEWILAQKRKKKNKMRKKIKTMPKTIIKRIMGQERYDKLKSKF